VTASAAHSRAEPPEPARHDHCGPGERPPDASGVRVDGVTMRWGLHQLTAARAREFGIDLLRWPLDEPAAGWQQRAACAGVDSEVADQLTECLSQSAATELVRHLCSACAVRTACFEMGRTTGGHGVWGGVVLHAGRVAPWRTATEKLAAKLARTAELATEDATVEIIGITEDMTQIEELERPKAAERMEAGVTLGPAGPRVAKAMRGERGPRSDDVAAGAVGMSRVTTGGTEIPALVGKETASVTSRSPRELHLRELPAETPRRRGQRSQPRRLSRARRRGRHAPVA